MTTDPTILIVDDDPINLKVLQGVLKETGYKILVANSGERALYQVQHQPPDLILLDVLMSGLDGFETCRQLKQDPTVAGIPVIFMTALSDVESKVRGFESGGVDYITKPFHRAEVLARVNTHLSIYHLQQQLAAQNVQLQKVLEQVSQLSGLLPICSRCKKIRNEKGNWQELEGYIRDHSEAEFSQDLCPSCRLAHFKS